MAAPFRTYRLGGDFVSVDLGQHIPPTEYDEYWDISEEAYNALYAHDVPYVEPLTGELDVGDQQFPPPDVP